MCLSVYNSVSYNSVCFDIMFKPGNIFRFLKIDCTMLDIFRFVVKLQAHLFSDPIR